MIILNSEDVVQDLLEKRSHNYSDRIHLPIREPYGFSQDMIFRKHDDTWRAHRRVAQQGLRADAVKTFQSIQRRCSLDLIRELASTPHAYLHHFEKFSASVILSAVYDHEVTDDHDPMVENVTTMMALFSKLLLPQNSVLVQWFPFLKYTPTWLPWGWFNMESCRSSVQRTLNMPFEELEQKITSGEVSSSVALDAMERFRTTGKISDVDEVVKGACCSLFVAGFETTTSTLMVFLLAMLLYPNAQKRAQDEIDAVVGVDRLPYFEDKSALPFLEAIFRETLRWYPVVPLGIPHASTNGDLYRGYDIPAGALVIANIWALSRDSEKYPSPSEFRPERFLDANGNLTNDTVDFAFGFGRRVCVGRHFAVNSLWLAMARILAAFNIQRQRDESGKLIELKVEWVDGVTSMPKPFPCELTPKRQYDAGGRPTLT
ncbi:cytochrome P450 [Coniophora puteana RWD-64-598 SS2]|uniref:Cytochrome P450 n=1 Tax=Coniophora puteana (strain RWD-64-598) TaxID=741705 RepID=R7SEG3_CONPW|nr:cytochrome P450 [Coniophora puteana RWD-64-598 SS2]EIW74568.1 cytochrome P450 [Coniophora puteana RWD-64-598 SS2]